MATKTTQTLTRSEALKLAAACKGTEHGYVVGAYTKLTLGKAAALLARSALATASYAGAFAKNTAVGFAKTK